MKKHLLIKIPKKIKIKNHSQITNYDFYFLQKQYSH